MNCMQNYHKFVCGKRVRVKNCPFRHLHSSCFFYGNAPEYWCELREKRGVDNVLCSHRPNHLLPNCIFIQMQIAEEKAEQSKIKTD